MYDEMTYDVIPKILHHHPIRIFTSPQDECAGLMTFTQVKANKWLHRVLLLYSVHVMFEIFYYERLKKINKRTGRSYKMKINLFPPSYLLSFVKY